MRAWQVVRHGAPSEALELRDVPTPEPGPGEILVEASASVCNYNEVDGCYGRYLTIDPTLPYTLGMECVGRVVAAGPGAEAWLGKRVTTSGPGGTGAHAEQVLGSAAMTFEAPDRLDDAEAAAFFYPFHLAHLGLHERGRLAKGETVLVHAAAGGVGSAAVQLAAAAGARVIATVGSQDKVGFVESLGADVVVNYRDVEFDKAVLEATGGRGVDVCFDGVGGDVTMRSLRCLVQGGRHLIVGFASGIEAEEVPMVSGRVLCFGNFDLIGVILTYLDAPPSGIPGEYAPVPVPRFNPCSTETGRRVQAHLVELLEAGRIRPVVGERFPFDTLPVALARMESRATMGRIVIER
ncbi:MAG: zinc-binding dehydrogenase [Spirochaetaceae bacterium]|nr:zinc-binding dehydrogenase [Spirochaetaceae bacterium]HPG24232.1 zinc-binding dehydrogenase [Myxococcota bacterium]